MNDNKYRLSGATHMNGTTATSWHKWFVIASKPTDAKPGRNSHKRRSSGPGNVSTAIAELLAAAPLAAEPLAAAPLAGEPLAAAPLVGEPVWLPAGCSMAFRQARIVSAPQPSPNKANDTLQSKPWARVVISGSKTNG